MKFRHLLSLPFLTALIYTGISGAVPAKPGPVSVDTPDGEVSLRLVGDERFHQYLSDDGFPLMENNGYFYYCNLNEKGEIIPTKIRFGSSGTEVEAYKKQVDLSDIRSRLAARAEMVESARAMSASKPSKIRKSASDNPAGPPYEMGPGLFPLSKGPRFPAYGKQKALVILVEYRDVAFNTEDPYDYFSRMLNENGFSDYGATGSASDYFRFNSMNVFDPDFDVYGPVKLSKNRSYYGANDPWGNDLRPHQMVIEALETLDPEVDFSQYDCDGDGMIDNIFIFYAGRGENAGGGAVTVWPHANTLSNLKESGHIYDGVEADRYGCTNEWTGKRPDGVGTFIHEFGHVMGLPDLYPTGYASAFSPENWAVMDHGSYNNDGMTPPLYSAFERYALGWLRPNEIDRPVSASLQPISNNMAGIIRTDRANEFFLIENRQQNGWDTYIPGHGMLIWHIDYNEAIWTKNTVNNTPSHQYVDLVEADNIRTDDSRAGDCFPGTAGVTSFTATTTPGMTTWGGTALEYPITSIKETADGLVTFDILGGASTEIPTITVNEPSGVTAFGFKLSWTTVPGLDHLVSVYTRNPDEGIEFVEPYRYLNAGENNEIEISGLESEKKYFVTVCATNGWEMGTPSEEKSVTTERMNLSYYQVEAAPATDVETNSFKACWNALEGAKGYEVNLLERIATEPNKDVCDFTDGGNSLPSGWESSSTSTYGMGSFCGQAVPSLRMSTDGDYLITPVFDDEISKISFWHRGNGSDKDAVIIVEALGLGGYIEVARIPVVTEAGGKVSEIIPEVTTPCIRLTFRNPGGTGSLALDDVEIIHGMNYKFEACKGEAPTDAGSATSFIFEDLRPASVYGYTVTAYDDTYRSIPSEMIVVTTAEESSIKECASTTPLFYISGRIIRLSSGLECRLYNAAGILMASGRGSVEAPTGGIFILSLPSEGKSFRINIHK